MSLPRLDRNAKFSVSSPNLARLRAERDREELRRQDRVQAIRHANHLGSVDFAAACIAGLTLCVVACSVLALLSY